MVKGRFAPSPTGRMHIGNVMAALLSWLSVRKEGGTWLLRHEDLDPDRSHLDYAAQIEADLLRLGLEWDEGGLQGRGGISGGCLSGSAGVSASNAGPYVQSQRGGIYEEQFERIRQLTYPCWCTRADILAAQAPHESDGRVVYPGTCRRYVNGNVPDGPAAVRLVVPDREIRFTDLHYGPQGVNLSQHCGDFVVRRKDGGWAYQFAVVVDDALMGVTEVVRGRDLLLSTAQQLYLFDLLGFTPPLYAHFPLLCSQDGRRLSKRDAAADIDAYRSPEQLIGFLGCAAGLTDRPEPCRAGELVPLFSWDKVPLEDIRL